MALTASPFQRTAGKSKIKQHTKYFIQKNPQADFFFYNQISNNRSVFRSGELILTTGASFSGLLCSQNNKPIHGEVVFTTGMTGYVETLTDPSYAGQIITFTYPLIGNYGVPARKHWEHKCIAARGVIVSEACAMPSHYQSERSLLDWLKDQNIPLFLCSDTRALTKAIREYGTPIGRIQYALAKKKSDHLSDFFDPSRENLIAEVSVSKEKTYGKGRKIIIAVDCGMKERIIRELLCFDVTVIRVPYNYDYTQRPFDGVFVSNGPGDPSMAKDTIAILKKAMAIKKPIFGICLGSQLMGIAGGAKTYKLPYGHRGGNQPCRDSETGKCFITSQNHGYAVNEKTLSKDWTVTFRNLNDDSIEGIAHRTQPFFSVQFHPEATPGPTDTRFLFEKFIKLL